MINRQTDYFFTLCSTEVENCNVLRTCSTSVLQYFLTSPFKSLTFWRLTLKLQKMTINDLFLILTAANRAAIITKPLEQLSTFKICNTRSYQAIKPKKMAKNLNFKFLVKKWQSLGELLSKNCRKSWKHVFYTNWTILSRKIFFSKKFFWIIQNLENTESAISRKRL